MLVRISNTVTTCSKMIVHANTLRPNIEPGNGSNRIGRHGMQGEERCRTANVPKSVEIKIICIIWSNVCHDIKISVITKPSSMTHVVAHVDAVLHDRKPIVDNGTADNLLAGACT